MRRVILESPYAGNVVENVAYARRCVRDSLLRGEAPIASHLLYTQPGILKDEVPEERQHGIEAGLAWRAVAEASAVYTDRGITPGMRKGIEAAGERGLPIEYRTLGEAESYRAFPVSCVGASPLETGAGDALAGSERHSEDASLDEAGGHVSGEAYRQYIEKVRSRLGSAPQEAPGTETNDSSHHSPANGGGEPDRADFIAQIEAIRRDLERVDIPLFMIRDPDLRERERARRAGA